MIIDIVVIAVLLISALISFLRGFIREVLTILGVVGGLAAAYVGGPMLAPSVKGWLGVKEGEEPERLLDILPYPILGDILSYGLIFIAVVIVLSLASHLLAESARKIGLGSLDRTLGVIFGLLRGVLLLGVLYLPLHIIMDKETRDDLFGTSKTQFYLEAVAEGLAKLLPDSALKQIEDTGNKVKEKKDSAVKEKLKQIDLLKDPDQPVPAEPEVPQPGGPGYTDEFRNDMDKLFKQDGPQPNMPSPPQPQPEAPHE